MEYSMISGSRSDFFLRLSFVFLQFAFLLFPVAHLSIGGGIPIYWAEAVIGLSFLAFILHDPKLAYARLRDLLREEPRFFLCIGLFLFGIALAYLFNPHSISGLGEMKSFYIAPIFLLIAILIHAQTKSRIESLALSWLLGIVAAALAGVVTYTLGWLSYDGRLTGLYLSPNYLAMLAAPGVLLAGYFLATRVEHRYRMMISFSAVLILFTLWATRSYAAWTALFIAFIGTAVLWWGMTREYRFRIFPLLLIAVLIGAVLVQERGTEKWQGLVSRNERSSLASRVMIWNAALKITQDSFPVGIGTGRFQEVYLANQKYFPTYLEWAVPTPHNLYLHFLLEGGLATLMGWIGCVLILCGRAYRRFSRGLGDRLFVLGLGLMLFYLVYGVVDTPYMKNDLALAVWGSLGLLLGALRIKA